MPIFIWCESTKKIKENTMYFVVKNIKMCYDKSVGENGGDLSGD